MTLTQFVNDLPYKTMFDYAHTDISEQFEFARSMVLDNDDCPAPADMDGYDAMEIALDTRATAMGIF